jgi:hypothetical protein
MNRENDSFSDGLTTVNRYWTTIPQNYTPAAGKSDGGASKICSVMNRADFD